MFFFKTIFVVCFIVLASADDHHKVDRRTRNQVKSKSTRVEDANYWRKLGQDLLKEELNKKQINSLAKNVIFFLGDGMSIPTVTAGRIYKGQKAGYSGEEAQLVFDQFPYVALSKTYCVDSQVADSACSATAYLSGIKTDISTIGLDFNVEYRNCSTQNILENRVDSIMAWAQAAKKGTGIVTTTRVTNATPAGAYAHVASRDWENDYYVNADGQNITTCDDIAEQLVNDAPGKNFKVVLGGGRFGFTPNTENDPETGKGRRLDGQNLINKWKSNNPNSAYVISRQELLDVDPSKIDKLLGLFSADHMEYFTDSEGANNPTLEEMTRSAIRMLQKEDYGYVLLVEGGKIDMGHHIGRAKLVLEEMLQFDLAIEAALSMTNRSDTLIIVTADHAHTMTINGYPDRGADILGKSQISDVDFKPYTTLSYATGPGYKTGFNSNGTRPDLTNVDTTDKSFVQPATVPKENETHGGDDVAIFATGPQAHLFQGVYEQHYIAHVIGYAACIGPGLHFCDQEKS